MIRFIFHKNSTQKRVGREEKHSNLAIENNFKYHWFKKKLQLETVPVGGTDAGSVIFICFIFLSSSFLQ